MNDILKDLNIKPSKSLYREQKTEATLHECRHLKKIYTREGDISNERGSITIKKTFCSQCHKELNEKDLKERARLLTKFKK
jgi:hypothetical protein